MAKKLLAHGKMVDWRHGGMQFVVKDSTQSWFSGEENILITNPRHVKGKFYEHIVKEFGEDLSKLKIDIIIHK